MNNGEITDTVLHWAELRARRRRRGGLRDRDVPALPAAVVPDPVVVGARDGGDADHGAARAASWTCPEELVVTAYQSASGLMNLFIPTSAVVMGGLAIARVPYDRYLRWVWPLLAAAGRALRRRARRRGGSVMTRSAPARGGS